MAIVKLSNASRARPLFNELGYNLAIDSIIGGITKGLAFADNEDNPQTALLWNLMDTLILAGLPDDSVINQQMNWLLEAVVFPNARQRYIPSLTLHYSPRAWREQEEILLAGIPFSQAHRRYYQFIEQKTDWTTQIPEGSQVRPIDRSLIVDDSLGNISEVRGWLSSFWNTIESFETHGLGFCLVIGDIIASWCLAVYASGRHVELGLATAAEYRNRGFATLVGGACIDLCLRSDRIPHWHTFEDNRRRLSLPKNSALAYPKLTQCTACWSTKFEPKWQLIGAKAAD